MQSSLPNRIKYSSLVLMAMDVPTTSSIYSLLRAMNQNLVCCKKSQFKGVFIILEEAQEY